MVLRIQYILRTFNINENIDSLHLWPERTPDESSEKTLLVAQRVHSIRRRTDSFYRMHVTAYKRQLHWHPEQICNIQTLSSQTKIFADEGEEVVANSQSIKARTTFHENNVKYAARGKKKAKLSSECPKIVIRRWSHAVHLASANIRRGCCR